MYIDIYSQYTCLPLLLSPSLWPVVAEHLEVGAFVVEICLKIVAFGCREFWCGSLLKRS